MCDKGRRRWHGDEETRGPSPLILSPVPSRSPLTPALSTRKGGTTNLKVGGQWIGRWGVKTVKTLKFEKGGGTWNSMLPNHWIKRTPALMVALTLSELPHLSPSIKLRQITIQTLAPHPCPASLPCILVPPLRLSPLAPHPSPLTLTPHPRPPSSPLILTPHRHPSSLNSKNQYLDTSFFVANNSCVRLNVKKYNFRPTFLLQTLLT